MTDFETMTAMFVRAGVEHQVTELSDGRVVQIEAGTTNVGGYAGFMTYLYFTISGALKKAEIYE